MPNFKEKNDEMKNKYNVYNESEGKLIDAVWATSLTDACNKWISMLSGSCSYEIREGIVAIVTNITNNEKEIKYFILQL